MTTKNTLLAMAAILIYGCDGSPESGDAGTTSNGGSCLAEFASDPCTFLDEAYLAEHAGANADSVEITTNDDVSKKSKYVKPECQYEWPSDRKSVLTMEAAGREIQTGMPVPNTILIGDFDIIDDDGFKKTRTDNYADYFQRVYGIKTKAEKEQIKEDIARAAEKSDKVDKGSADTISGMVDSQPAKKEISGLGDKAVASVLTLKNYSNWSKASLFVLHKNVVFSIEVDVSEDNSEDLEMAKKIAQKIIDRCE
jgi:hypothetical protein